MKLNEFFEKAYYVNLDRRIDRNDLFKAEMERVGLLNFFERFSAEDGIGEPDAIKKHHYCAYSHYKLFEKIYEEGYERVLVFEDDAFFYDEGPKTGMELVSDALDELQNFPDWDMIYLGGCPVTPIEKVSNTLCLADIVLNTHAIGFKRSTIKFVLDKYTPFGDGFIDTWYGAYKTLTKYIVNPIAVPQNSTPSDLDAHGHRANMGTYFECFKRNLIIKDEE